MYYKRVIIDEKGKRHIANFAGEFVVMDMLTKCGKYLELYINTDAVRRNHFNFRIRKINHGMNNKINMWFDNKPSYESTTFKSQSEAGRYIQRCL